MHAFRQMTMKTLLILSAAVVLRAIIPAGYMPAGAGSGLLFEFCPDGVPAEFMDMLSGGASHDHAGHDHASHGESEDGHECSMGHIVLSAAVVDDAVPSELERAPESWSPNIQSSFASTARVFYRPRGPPA